MAYGLLASGFTRKPQATIKAEIEDDLRTSLGSSINLLGTSVLGQLVGTFSERESLVWELMEAVYNQSFPDTATGVSLDNAVALTGVTRRAATFSNVVARCFGDVGTVIPSGTIFSVNGVPENTFATQANATILTGQNEVQTISFSAVPDAGDFRLEFDGETIVFPISGASPFLANAIKVELENLSNIDLVVTAGDASSGVTVEFQGVNSESDVPLITVPLNTCTNGGSPVTITVTETTPGLTPFADVECQAQNSGQVVALAGTLTVIDTPVFGLDSVTNPLDADVGLETETDAELRARRLENLTLSGRCTVDGIVQSLLQITDVEAVTVVENTSLVTDGDGRPGKSFETFVVGGADQDIIDEIWKVKPAGIETYGDITGTTTDIQGFSQTVKFSRPTAIDIYMIVNLVTNTDPAEPGGVYPANGDDQVKQAILEYGQSFVLGQDVVSSRFFTPINTIQGVVGIEVLIGTSPSPTGSANIPIAATAIAVFDSTRITVNS